MKRIMFVIPVVALFAGTFLPSTSFAQCLFNCSMGSTSPSPDWDLSQSGRLEIHFDEGETCESVFGVGSEKCPPAVLSAKPRTDCKDSNNADCACPETVGDEVTFSLETRDNFLVFGQFKDKVQGKDTVLANGCFKFQVVHNYAEVRESGAACEVVQFADPDSTGQMSGFVSRTLKTRDTGPPTDDCGIADVVPGCESVLPDEECRQYVGGQALKEMKLETAFPPTDDLAPKQTLLARQDPEGGSVVLSRPCAGKQGEDESSIECIESGKPHDAAMDADLVAECVGDWFPASVNANGTNPHKFAIIDQGNCDPREIDQATVKINGQPTFGCSLRDVGGDPLIDDLVCSAIEGEVAKNTPIGSETCKIAEDDGNMITVIASGVTNIGGDDVPLEAPEFLIPCKFN